MHPSVAQAVMEEERGTAFGQKTLKRAILQASVSQGENQEIPKSWSSTRCVFKR
jgi:hypothetical protein